MPVSVYFQTWSSKWVSVGAMMDLANVPDGVDIVYLSFCMPMCSYLKGSRSFAGTGLQFSMDFDVVKNAIAILKSRKIKTMISVGGATYHYEPSFNQAQTIRIWDLCVDLGCDGVDIDWESQGISQRQQFVDIINYFHNSRPTSMHLLCAACFSVGAFQPSGNPFNGMNILGLQQAGRYLNWINIMAYDAGGPDMYDVQAAYEAYKTYYPGLIYIGLEIGPQAWGGDLLKIDQVRKALTISRGNVFIWSLQKPPTGTVSVEDILKEARSLSVVIPPVVVPTPPSTVTTSTKVSCPNCKKDISLELTYLPK